MSYLSYTAPGLFPTVAARPLIQTSNTHYPAALAVLGGAFARRKIADDDEDEHPRSAKKCKRAGGDTPPNRAKVSIKAAGKKRVRAEGKAVKLRNTFIKSLRNIPKQSDSRAGVEYPFTFTPLRFEPVSDASTAMEDIEVYTHTMDLDVGEPSVIAQQQIYQASMSIDSLQDVDPADYRLTSTSISTVDMDMDETSEPVQASDTAARSSDDANSVPDAVPAPAKNLIARFLARTAPAKSVRPTALLARERSHLKKIMLLEDEDADEDEDDDIFTEENAELGVQVKTEEGSSDFDEELVRPSSQVYLETIHVVASPVQDMFTPATPVKTEEGSSTEDNEVPESVSVDEWLASLERDQGPCPVYVASIEDVEAYELLYLKAPIQAQSESKDDMFAPEYEEERVGVSSVAPIGDAPKHYQLQCPKSSVLVKSESEDNLFGPVLSIPVVAECQEEAAEGEAEDIQEFYDACDQGMEVFFSLPPSQSPSQSFQATKAQHSYTGPASDVRQLLINLSSEPQDDSPPSLCKMDSDDSSAYASDSDESSVGTPTADTLVTPCLWTFRESRILPDLEEDDVAVVVHAEEVFESGVALTAADSRFGSLVSLMDKWSYKDTPSLPTASSADSLLSSDSDMDIWYDAMDCSVTPSASLGDISMSSDSSVLDDLPLELAADIFWDAQMDLDPIASSASLNTSVSGFDDNLPACACAPSACASSPCRLFEDNLTESMLIDAPSVDLIDFAASPVRMPVPALACVLPGAWPESFESEDDLLL
ncbi:hypothetical protein C8Q77DRAFT_1074422 [Trametes polyzona]|nr:hypothetical protein C8Q77DRAFT_1074422 [Trametes polyzona]